MRILLLLCLVFIAAIQPPVIYGQCNDPFPLSTGPQACMNAPLFCANADLDGYCSATGNTGVGTCPPPFCSGCQNFQWFKFVANTQVLSLTITPSNCTHNNQGLQAHMYQTNDCVVFTSVSNCANPGTPTPVTITANNLLPGETYYVMIDGFSMDICDFVIDVVQGSIADLPPALIQGGITGPANVCPGASLSYSVQGSFGIVNYNWTLTPAIGVINNNGENNITINFIAPGNAQLCVTPTACEVGDPVCMQITSALIPQTVIPVSYCFGQSVQCSGNTISTPGPHYFTYQSWLGCDSVVNCLATAILPLVMPPVQAAICQGGSYSFAGQTFNATGGYPVTLTAANGCDSIVTLILVVMEVNAVIQPPPVLGCGPNAAIVLNATGSTTTPAAANAVLSYSWSGPGIASGQTTLTPTVNLPGVYTLTVTETYLGTTCTAQASVVVIADTAKPNPPTLTGPLSACTGNTSVYTATPAGSGPSPTSYTWTVTGGTFTTSGNTATVTWTEAGAGQVCATANNDCGPSAPACLTINLGQSPATPSLTGPDWVCAGDVVYFIVDPLDPNTTSYSWTVGGNASFTDLGDSILVNFSGASSGQICVTGENACGTSVMCIDVTVETIPAQPLISGVGSVCNGEVATYSVAAITNATSYNWTVPAGATIESGQGTEAVTINWTGASSGNVCVRAGNDCGQSPQACFAVLVNDAPTAVLSGGGQFCAGSGTNVNLAITLTGAPPWDIVYAIDGIAQPPLPGIAGSPYTLTTGIPGVYTLISLDNIAPCPGIVSGMAAIVENLLPSALLSGSGSICQGSGDCVPLQVLLTGAPPWTLIFTLNSVAQAPLTGIANNPYIYNACQGGTYGIASVTDGNGCSETGAGSATVTVNTAPVASNIQVECNATSTGYTVSFVISGGDPGSYTVNGSGAGISAGPPYIFTSAEIPNFTGYSFVVDDANHCNPLTVSQAMVLCDCISAVGDMAATPQQACGASACITPVYDPGGETLDGDDAMQFILHTGSGLAIVNEIARNVVPTFCFDAAAGMAYGTTYFISAVVGNDMGGGMVDLADPCLAVAQGTPVVFYQQPEGVMSGDAAICIGQSATLSIHFTGPGPYIISYDNGTSIQTVNGINANPYLFSVTPTATTVYALTAVSNANCAGVALSGATVTVNGEVSVANLQTACNSTNTQYVVSFSISGGDPSSYMVLPPGAGTLAGGDFVSFPIPAGSGYSFQIADINSCNVAEVSAAMVNCDCTTAAGEMDQSLIEECGNGPVTATYNAAGQYFDGDDVLEFVLHTGSGNAIGYPILGRSPTPAFSFDAGAGMSYNTTYYISAIVGSDDGTGGVNDLNDPCLAVATGTPVIFRVVPSATLSGTQAICLGANATLQVALTGDAPWAIAISDGATTQTLSGINSTNYNYLISQPQATATYTLLSVNDEFCAGPVSGSATITVNAPPVNAAPVVTINSTNTGYTVCFEISGGTGGPYTVTNGSQVWTVDGLFCSDELPCGTGYYFEYDDVSGCGPIVVSEAMVVCACTTAAGDMDQTPLLICGSGPAAAAYDPANQVLDGNDAVDFMLHNGNNVPIHTSSTPSFNFSALLSYGTTYYISARAGNDLGSGAVDPADPCLSVALGTPVIFYQIPSATLSGGGDFCVGDEVDLTVEIAGGTAPWTVTYTNTQGQQASVSVLSSPHTFQVSPGNSTLYTLTGVSDANCAGTNVGGLAVFTQHDQPYSTNVQVTPDAANEFVTVCFTIAGGDPATWSVTGGAGTLTGDQFCSDPIPCAQETYQFFLQDAFACGVDIIEGPVNCPCESGAGVMNSMLHHACEFESITVPAAFNPALDGNDVLVYALHTGNGSALGNIIAVNSAPAFTYSPAIMNCNTTYYVSSVVGNNDGAGMADLNDPCLSVAAGTPVIFHCLPTVSFSGSGSICLGGSRTIMFSLGFGLYDVLVHYGTQDTLLKSIANSHPLVVSPTQTTTYTLVSVKSLATGCENAASGSVTVTVNNPVNAGAALPPADFCAGDNQLVSLFSLLTGADVGGVWTETSSAPSTGGAFNPGAGTFNPATQAPGTYKFRYFMDGMAPCPDDSETVTVIIYPLPIADAGPPQQLNCNATSVAIGGSGTSQGANFSYAWTMQGVPGILGTQAALTATQAGIYALTVTDTETGCSASSQTSITQDFTSPVATVTTYDVTCFGYADGQIFVSSVTGGKPPFLYSINGGPFTGQQLFSNLAGGDYLIEVQDANGCETSVLVNIFEPEELTATLIANIQPSDGGDYFIEMGEELTLALQSSYPLADLDHISWSPADVFTCNDVFCSSVTTAPTEAVIFKVEIAWGPCEASDQLRVLVRKSRPVFIPNAFSPNDDGENDILTVYGGRQVELIKSMQIFNRWGEKMYEAYDFLPNDRTAGWNGYHRGKRVDPGVYAFFVEVRYADGYVEMIKGNVTLVR